MLPNGLSHIYAYSYQLFRAKQKEKLNLLSKTEEILNKTEDDLFGNEKIVNRDALTKCDSVPNCIALIVSFPSLC